MALTKFPKGILATPNLGGSAAIPPTTGTIYFVDSNGGTRGDGKSPQTAKATIAAAYALCKANKGDQIWVMPSHAESIAAATPLATAGVGIYGLPDGAKKPVITFTGTGSSFDITGAGIRMSGLTFLGGISAVAIGVDVSADYFTMDNCNFFFGTTTAYDFAICIDVDGSDFCTIENCRFILEDTAGCNEAISFDDAQELVIRNCYFSGDFTNGMIYTASGDAASNDILIEGCSGYNSDTTAGKSIYIAVDGTGIIRNCSFTTAYTAAPSTTFDNGGCACSNCFAGWPGDYAPFAVPFGVLPNWYMSKKSQTYAGANASATLAIGTVGTYGLYTISGTIEATLCGIIGTSLDGASGTISVGVTGDPDALLGVTTGTDLDANEVWIATAGLASSAPWTDGVHRPVVICGAASKTIFHTVATNDVGAGQIDYHLYWRPLEPAAYVKAK